MAAPVTYEIGGEQYVAVLSGWGGAYPLMQGKGSDKSGNTRNVSRVLVLKRLAAKPHSRRFRPSPAADRPTARRSRRDDGSHRKSAVRSLL